MRRALTLVVGILIGQWLAFGAHPSPADLYAAGRAAWQRQDYGQALRFWSHGAALQPGDAVLHFWRASALARLGHRHEAADAFRLALLLEPPGWVATAAQAELASLEGGAAGDEIETVVPVEASRGVWIATVVINEAGAGRVLVDTGSSATLVSPRLARAVGLRANEPPELMELQTVGGLTSGVVSTARSIRVGRAELRDVPVVLHDPGPGVDGILGNTFLGRWRLTLDAERRLLHPRRPDR